MARIRTIKPEFFRHELLYQYEQEMKLPLRLAYIGLWTVADREGRFKWRPGQLKLDCLPYDEVDFSRVLNALGTGGFIVKYEFDGEEYGYIPSFCKHQVINNKERESELPNPLECNVVLTREPRVTDAKATPLNLSQGEYGKGIWNMEGKGKGTGRGISRGDGDANVSIHFDAFWDLYPKQRRVARKTCADIWKRRGLDKDAEVILNGLRQWLTASDWTKDGGKFVPNPQTFLNQERWNDVAAAMVIAPQSASPEKASFKSEGEKLVNYYLNRAKENNNV